MRKLACKPERVGGEKISTSLHSVLRTTSVCKSTDMADDTIPDSLAPPQLVRQLTGANDLGGK